MAEIHVQAKKHQSSSTSWVWIVLGLLLVGAIIYFLTRNKETDNRVLDNNATTTGATGAVQHDMQGAYHLVA